MRKNMFYAVAGMFAIASGANAQTMNVNTNGQEITIKTENVDSVTFGEPTSSKAISFEDVKNFSELQQLIKDLRDELETERSVRKELEKRIDAQAEKEATDVLTLKAAINQNAADLGKVKANVDQVLIDSKAYTDAAIAIQTVKDANTYATITDVNKQITDVLNKFQSISDEIAAVKGEWGSLKAALDAQKAALEAELSVVQRDIAVLKNYAEELKAKTIPTIEEEIKRIYEYLKK